MADPCVCVMQHLQPNNTLQGEKYRIERVLRQGGFGDYK